jgi:hypothetical protein
MSYSTNSITRQSARYYETYKKPLKSYTFSSYDANKNNYKSLFEKLKKISNVNIDYDEDSIDEEYEESSLTLPINDFKEEPKYNGTGEENEERYRESKCIKNRYDELISKGKNELNSARLVSSVKRSQSLQSIIKLFIKSLSE